MLGMTLLRVVPSDVPPLAGVAVWAGVLLLLALYFLPTLLARHKRNGVGIFALNLLFGWTVVGWLGALVWAVTGADE
jgi:hypothetical protein